MTPGVFLEDGGAGVVADFVHERRVRQVEARFLRELTRVIFDVVLGREQRVLVVAHVYVRLAPIPTALRVSALAARTVEKEATGREAVQGPEVHAFAFVQIDARARV